MKPSFLKSRKHPVGKLRKSGHLRSLLCSLHPYIPKKTAGHDTAGVPVRGPQSGTVSYCMTSTVSFSRLKQKSFNTSPAPGTTVTNSHHTGTTSLIWLTVHPSGMVSASR